MSTSNIPNNDGAKYRFLFLDLIYLLITYVWVLGFPLSGEEYSVYLDFYGRYSDVFFAHLIFSPVLVRCVNVLFCYINMVLIFFITREVIGGLWWLGSLSAVVFMAHPIMSLNIAQPIFSTYLINLAIGLGVVYVNLGYNKRKLVVYLTSLMYSIISLFVHVHNALLIILSFILRPGATDFEGDSRKAFLTRMGDMFLLIFSTVWIVLNRDRFFFSFDIYPQTSLLVYPLGWLRESWEIYNYSPLIAFISSGGVLSLFFVIGWSLKNKGILKLFFSLVLLLIFPVEREVNLFQPLRNGHLIYPLTFGSIAFAGICGELQKLPRWNSSIIKGTAILCLAMIIFQFFLHFERGYGIWEERRLSEGLVAKCQDSQCGAIVIFPKEIRTRWFTFNIYEQMKRNLTNKKICFLGVIENYEKVRYSAEGKIEENNILTITIKGSDIDKLGVNWTMYMEESKEKIFDGFLVLCKGKGGIELKFALGKILGSGNENSNVCLLIWDGSLRKFEEISLT